MKYIKENMKQQLRNIKKNAKNQVQSINNLANKTSNKIQETTSSVNKTLIDTTNTLKKKTKNKINETTNKVKETGRKGIQKLKEENSKELYSYKIKLSKDIDNKNMSELCKGLYDYVPLIKRLNKEKNMSSTVFNPHQTCFEVVVKSKDIEFNLHTKRNPIILKNLYTRYYPSCNLQEVENLEMATEDDLIIEYNLKEHYFQSLSTDYTHLQPIGSFMDLQNALEEKETIMYQVILTAADPDWGESAEQAKSDYKENDNNIVKMPKDISFNSITKFGIDCIGVGVTEVINVANELIFDEPEKIELKKSKTIKFSHATLQKSKYTGFKTTIRAIIHSNSNSRKEILSHMVNNSLSFMDADNKLEPTIISKKNKSFYSENKNEYIKRVNDRQPSNKLIENNILNVNEIGKLIMLPTKSLQEKFFVDKNVVVTNTNTLDADILNGKVRIGDLIGDAKNRMTFYPLNPELYCISKICTGGMGSGKSNFTVGYINDSISMGNTVFQFDYIDVCQIAQETKKSNPNHIAIKPAQMLNFTYPEVDASDLPIQKKALDFSNCVLKLIDTLNIGNMNDMTGRMKKTLRSAAVVCYLCEYKNIRYVYKALTEIDFREELLNKIDSEYSERFSMYISTLENLTVTKKNVVVNDDDSIKYLLDRFDALMGDGNLMDMFFNEDNDIDFSKLLNSKKLVTIELPESEYTHKWVKDVVVCFLLHRIWIATKNRPIEERDVIVDIILDEVHQLENTKDFVSEYACEIRKFRLSFLFCCQYFNQFKRLLESVEGGSVHYIMLQGSIPTNYTHIEPLVKDFSLQNFMDLPKHHSLNVILTKQGYQSFITHLPKHY